MSTYRLWPSTSGPSSATSANSAWLSGTIFSVTGGVKWLNGYYWWCCNSGQTTTAQKFALWNRYSLTQQNLVSAATAESGTLTAGAWNYVPLATPVPLAPGALYVAATGWTATGIPLTSGQFGTGGAYAGGIVNGPLTAWSAQAANGGTNPFPASTGNYNLGQGLFSNALGSDPTVNMPNNGSGSDNFWLDIEVSDTPATGYSGSYRFYPNMADLCGYANDSDNAFTLGMQFSLSALCAAGNVWFYSPAGATALPTEIGVYQVSGESLACSNSSPSWLLPGGGAAAAGDGWMYAAMGGGHVLASGVNYKAVVFQNTNQLWNGAVANYWSTGFGANGLTAGPLSAPNNAGAVAPGQETYNQGAVITYPATNAGPYTYGIDIEVTPVASSGLLMAAGIT